MTSAIETKNLSISYGKNLIIHELDLKIPKGEITVFIGANGCGKSTLLRSIARLLKPTSGTVILEGKAIAKQREDFREGRPPKYTKKQIEHALALLETHSYKQVEEMTGISKSTLIRAKRKREQSVN